MGKVSSSASFFRTVDYIHAESNAATCRRNSVTTQRRHPEGPRFLQRAAGASVERQRCSSVTDMQSFVAIRPTHEATENLPRLHHDQPSALACSLHSVTGNLLRRVWQHKNRSAPGFTSRYNLTRMVYFERFVCPNAAIAREKEIKGWRRSKKIHLIESFNPLWDDLASSWYDAYKPATRTAPRQIPRPAGENARLRDDATRL